MGKAINLSALYLSQTDNERNFYGSSKLLLFFSNTETLTSEGYLPEFSQSG